MLAFQGHNNETERPSLGAGTLKITATHTTTRRRSRTQTLRFAIVNLRRASPLLAQYRRLTSRCYPRSPTDRRWLALRFHTVGDPIGYRKRLFWLAPVRLP